MHAALMGHNWATSKLGRVSQKTLITAFELYSLHSVLIDIFPYGTMTKGTTSVLINLINATDFFVGPPMF